MNHIALTYNALVAALLLLGLPLTTRTQTFLPDNAILRDTRSGDTIVGYANANALRDEMPGTSPTISFLSGSILGYVHVFHKSMVVVSNGTLDGSLVANDSSTVSFEGGSVPKLQARHSSTLLLSGGRVGGVQAGNDSHVMMSGGSLSKTLVALDNSRVVLGNGSIAGNLMAYNHSHVTVSGGIIGRRLAAFDHSEVSISGGDFANNVVAYDNSKISVSGGNIKGTLEAVGESSTLTMSGGKVAGDLVAHNQSRLTLSGGSVQGSLQVYNSAINLCGTDLRIILTHPEAVPGQGDPIQYTLFGKLRDGTDLTGKTLLMRRGSLGIVFFNHKGVNIPHPRYQVGGR